MPDDLNRSSDRPRFSLFQLMIGITIAGCVLGAVAINYQANRSLARLEREIQDLKQDNQQLQVQLRNSSGDLVRGYYAEKILLHLFQNSNDYVELVQALETKRRKILIAVHPLETKDNRTLIFVYSQDQKLGFPQFAQALLVHEKPFSVVSSKSGQAFRMPQKTDGRWVFPLKQNDSYVKFEISESQILRLNPSS